MKSICISAQCFKRSSISIFPSRQQQKYFWASVDYIMPQILYTDLLHGYDTVKEDIPIKYYCTIITNVQRPDIQRRYFRIPVQVLMNL